MKNKKIKKGGNKFEYSPDGHLLRAQFANGYWEEYEWKDGRMVIVRTSENRNSGEMK
jgi:hypothetical protein